jgi:NADH:ubiquinone oxidoreductase subunit C
VNPFDRLPDAAAEIFGEEATAQEEYGLLTVDVPAGSWIAALQTARDQLGCTYFDWLSAVDEPGTGFRVCAHVVSLGGGVRRLLVRTTVPHESPSLPTATPVFAGAAWHERETHEMFGIGFTGHPHLVPLLLPEGFEGHPLRKDFVLAARVAKAWPGAKEPGESEHGGPKRRQMLPPGVPDPNEWGPLKGQLPPAPARPARTPRAAGAAGAAAAARPARRGRSVTEGSVSQQPEGAAPGAESPERAEPRKRTPDAPWEQARPAEGEAPANPRPAPGAGGGLESPQPDAAAEPQTEADAVPTAEGSAAPAAPAEAETGAGSPDALRRGAQPAAADAPDTDSARAGERGHPEKPAAAGPAEGGESQ